MKAKLNQWTALKYVLLFGVMTTLLTGCIIWPWREGHRGGGGREYGHDTGRDHDHDDGPRHEDYEHR